MRRTWTLCMVCLVPYCSHAADADWLWAKQAGGGFADSGNSVAVLADGSAFVTGCFEDSAAFGRDEPNETILRSAGGYDIFIARYNPDGTLAWANRAGGPADDAGLGIAVTSGGSALVTGCFEGSAAFGTDTLASSGGSDSFVARYNPDGTLAWANKAGGAGDDWGNGIAATSGGSALVTGCFEGSAAFGTDTLASAGNGDIFVARYNTDGALAWASRAGGPQDDRGCGIAVLADGSAVVTGSFRGSVAFGTGTLASAGGSDIFIARFGSDGTPLWAKQAGGTLADSGYGVAVLADGSAIVTGYFEGSAAFGDAALTSAGEYDAFVARWNPDGAPMWAERAGGPRSDWGIGIAVYAGGSVLVAGCFQDAATFGSFALASAGGSDVFIARHNADGSIAQVDRAGGMGSDYGNGVAATADGGQAVVTGYFEGSAAFGASAIEAAGGHDAFIAAFRQLPSPAPTPAPTATPPIDLTADRAAYGATDRISVAADVWPLPVPCYPFVRVAMADGTVLYYKRGAGFFASPVPYLGCGVGAITAADPILDYPVLMADFRGIPAGRYVLEGGAVDAARTKSAEDLVYFGAIDREELEVR